MFISPIKNQNNTIKCAICSGRVQKIDLSDNKYYSKDSQNYIFFRIIHDYMKEIIQESIQLLKINNQIEYSLNLVNLKKDYDFIVKWLKSEGQKIGLDKLETEKIIQLLSKSCKLYLENNSSNYSISE